MSSSSIDQFISIVGSYDIDSRDAAAFAKIAADSVEQTVNKHGCLYYIASQDLTQPNLFHLSEGWASQAALNDHVASRMFKNMLDQAFKLRILNREIYLSTSTGRVLMP